MTALVVTLTVLVLLLLVCLFGMNERITKMHRELKDRGVL